MICDVDYIAIRTVWGLQVVSYSHYDSLGERVESFILKPIKPFFTFSLNMAGSKKKKDKNINSSVSEDGEARMSADIHR